MSEESSTKANAVTRLGRHKREFVLTSMYVTASWGVGNAIAPVAFLLTLVVVLFGGIWLASRLIDLWHVVRYPEVGETPTKTAGAVTTGLLVAIAVSPLAAYPFASAPVTLGESVAFFASGLVVACVGSILFDVSGWRRLLVGAMTLVLLPTQPIAINLCERLCAGFADSAFHATATLAWWPAATVACFTTMALVIIEPHVMRSRDDS